MRIDGKVALVTGAASGIGAACARTLAGAGARVVVSDVDGTGGASVVAAISSDGGEAMFIDQNVTDEARWSQVVAAIEARFGRLDITVANAGIAIGGPIESMTLSDWQRQQAINLDGVFLSVRHSIAPMRRAGGGAIVLLSSVAGLRGAAGLAGYCATKGGVRLFAKAAAVELATDGIRVNSVHPGIIDTPIWSKMQDPGPERRNAPVIDPNDRVASMVPAGVMGTPQDVADCVLFLCSPASRYMTGAELVVDGGMVAGPVPRR